MKQSRIFLECLACVAVCALFGVVLNAPHKAELSYALVSNAAEHGGSVVPASCESPYFLEHNPGECGSNPSSSSGSSSSGGGSTSTGAGGGSSTGSGGGGGCSPFLGQLCSTPVNSCGMSNQGLRTCSGACSVVTPPSDASCPTPQVVFDPRTDTGGIGADGSGKRVGKGKSCTFSWSSVNATNCTLTGPGVNMSGKTGTVTSPPLDNISIYTLKCFNGGEVFATKTFTCSIAPSLIEI